MKRPRILHAPVIVINQQWVISRAQRELGYRSDFMVFNADRKELRVRDCDYNFHFDRGDMSFRPGRILGTLKFLIRFSVFFISALFKYDVFHFHSESFFGSRSSLDLMILRLFRKKIVFQYWGCDIRLKTISQLSEDHSTCDDCIRICQNSRKLRDNLTHVKYADFRVYGGSDAIRMVPDALYIPLAIDLKYWHPSEVIPSEHRLPEAKGAVRILHPFENSKARGDQKGTRFIKKAVEELKGEGYNIEFIFVDNVPYEAMKYYYQQADIVVVQLLMGTYSGVSVEAMAMGKPVVCYLNKDALRLLPKDNPIVNANPENIKEALKGLITDKARRVELGIKSRRHIEKYHDALKLAQEYIGLYNKDWR
ncbi:MAG: glycosyltransferase family 4 protein [Candidatus Omnitrophica bacterium]|nr:glycosyltransferase family 4 protein [Candidatus Omnitrophota bacterium]